MRLALAPALLLSLAARAAAQAEATVKSAAEGRVVLFGDISLADPWFLALLPLALLAVWHGRRRAAAERARFSVLPPSAPPRSLAQRLAWLPASLQALALVLLVGALARPLRGDVETTTESEGVDIAVMIDRSSSMGHKDLEGDRTRLEVVKDVVSDFARRRMTDREGAADRVGLFVFAKYPQQLCPFTLDVDAVQGFLSGVEMVSHGAEDGTGIGIALAKAVAVLRQVESKSKVVVLLTDGENNLDLISPQKAAELAAESGVRVYTIFAGRYVTDRFGRAFELDQTIDMRELAHLAEITGGRFFRARDRRSLEAAYAEIEALERTPRREKRFVEHYDLYPRLLLGAIGVYLASWMAAATFARRLP